eukprot:TRINITY_DN30586_c0_g1_i2.p1 TRINITY_DN30586_c0_g1~~TRINITY_DN30586_c0_g1_i2.p1  ORF type:complete len:360 (+),score=18.06 TRINITY_DN30586_c0_g1_i2:108-1187(+)
MAATFVEKSAFLAAPALSSLEQARSISTSVSLPAVQSKARTGPLAAVAAAYTKRDLETKSLNQLRAIARQRGVNASTKEQIIASLVGGSSYSASRPSYSSSSSSYSSFSSGSAASSGSADEAALKAKSLSELRALAAQKGLRGDTKAEIIKLLIAAGGVSSGSSSSSSYSSYSSPAASYSPAVGAASTENSKDYERRLAVKPLSKLRAVARMRGVTGNTRAELIKGLLRYHSGGLSRTASKAEASVLAQDRSTIADQLDALSLSQLRAMAKERGLRGDTRKELIKLLTNAPGSAAAPSYTNGAASSSYASYSSPAASAPSARLDSRDLMTKSMAQLRAIAAQRGIRGNTKQELVKALSA